MSVDNHRQGKELRLLGLSSPRFTVLRLLGGATVVAVGCWLSTLLVSPSEGYVIVLASFGSAIGTLCHGPRGAILGASITWLLTGGVLIIAAIIASAYVFFIG